MPEHRDGTPAAFRELESFLWHDFEDGPTAWRAWLRHRNLPAGEKAASASFDAAMRLHAALRALQASNAGLPDARGGGASHSVINRLTEQHGVRPLLGVDGSVCLRPADASDRAASLLVQALETMRLGLWRRFKVCPDASCRASFYDASKAAGKVWCEMATCGSRNKMRRHRARS